jgi:hypothetical protein
MALDAEDESIRKFCERNNLKFLPGDTAPWQADDEGPSPWPDGCVGSNTWPRAQRLRRLILNAIADGRDHLDEEP